MGCRTKIFFPRSRGRVMYRALITVGTAENLGLEKVRKLSWYQRVLLPKEMLSRTKKRWKR